MQRDHLHLQDTWEGMEAVHKEGFAKAIGVSNFSVKKLNHLLPRVSITPAVHQVSMVYRTSFKEPTCRRKQSNRDQRILQEAEEFAVSIAFELHN